MSKQNGTKCLVILIFASVYSFLLEATFFNSDGIKQLYFLSPVRCRDFTLLNGLLGISKLHPFSGYFPCHWVVPFDFFAKKIIKLRPTEMLF